MINAKLTLQPHVRWMLQVDHEAVLGIDHASFPDPWSEDDNLVPILRQRSCIGMVAEHHRRIVGFVVIRECADFLCVLRLATCPQYRRQGVGRAMIVKLIGKLSPTTFPRVEVAVRETNLAGQLFLRAQGFVATGILPGFYLRPRTEDAYLMQYVLADAPR